MQGDTELWDAYRQNPCDQTRNALITRYMPVAISAAHKVAGRVKRHGVIDRDDVYSTAVLGLIDAIEHHDPTKLSFESYAPWRIQGYCMDMLRNTCPIGRFSVSNHNKREQAIDEFKAEYGWSPSDEELIEKLTEKYYSDIIVQRIFKCRDYHGSETLTTITASHTESPRDRYGLISDHDHMVDVLNHYTQNDSEEVRLIARLHYIENQQIKTIAKSIGISCTYVFKLLRDWKDRMYQRCKNLDWAY